MEILDTWHASGLRGTGSHDVRVAGVVCPDERSAALERLGRMLGITAARPTGDGVPDATWTWPSNRRIERRVWEVKTGHAAAVPLKWITQGLGQVASDNPHARRHSVSCIVSDAETVEESAREAAKSVCLLHVDAVSALIDLMSERLLQYASRWGEDAMRRGDARALVEKRLPSGNWLEELLAPNNGVVLRRAEVISLFPKDKA